MSERVYLDHNATTPLCDEARAVMVRAMGAVGNPSSVHADGRAQRRVVEDAREQVAEFSGVGPANVVFTSGGSEANNAILRGIQSDDVLVSAFEHASVLDAVPSARRIPVQGDGVIDLEALTSHLVDASDTCWVSVMSANNETGVLQPIEAVAKIVRNAGARLHVDAVQAGGKMPVQPIVEFADAVSLSAHKFGGPQGVGALIVRDGVAFEPSVRGGGQERRRRAGTENVIGIAGFGAACAVAQKRVDAQQRVRSLRDGIETELAARAAVYGATEERLANTTCVRMPGVSAETQVMAFDLSGISVSAGSACSSGKVEASHVLLAMGIPETEASEAIRVSLGPDTTEEDVSRFIQAWVRISEQAGSEAA